MQLKTPLSKTKSKPKYLVLLCFVVVGVVTIVNLAPTLHQPNSPGPSSVEHSCCSPFIVIFAPPRFASLNSFLPPTLSKNLSQICCEGRSPVSHSDPHLPPFFYFIKTKKDILITFDKYLAPSHLSSSPLRFYSLSLPENLQTDQPHS